VLGGNKTWVQHSMHVVLEINFWKCAILSSHLAAGVEAKEGHVYSVVDEDVYCDQGLKGVCDKCISFSFR